MTQLQFYVDAWRQSADAIASLNAPAEAWERDTDLPGWRARDILAHLVHLERVLVEGESQAVGDTDSPLATAYTEAGVDALRGTSVNQLHEDFVALIAARSGALLSLPEDGSAPPPRTPGGIPWDTETLLRNRAFDMWVHEQDLRRALELPGNLDSPGAHLTVTVLSFALPYVVGKKVKAPASTSVRFVVTGPVPVDSTVVVGEDGRATTVAEPEGEATTTIIMDTETFVVLGSGRRFPADVEFQIEGDAELGDAIVNALNVTF